MKENTKKVDPRQVSLERIRNRQAVTKKDLCIAYGITGACLRLWLKKVPGIQRSGRNRYIPQAELDLIFYMYGNPADEPNSLRWK